jgi:hypothetical protein
MIPTPRVFHAKAAEENLQKKTFDGCIFQNLISADDERHLQGILPDVVFDCLLPPGQPSNSLDGYRHLGKLKTLSQRKISVEKRAERIQRDLEQNAKDLDARDPRNTVHAERKSYGIGGAVYCTGRWPFWQVLQGLCQAA